MWVFGVLLFVPIIIQHIKILGYTVGYQKKNEYALAFFFFFLTILVMLRHESVGIDTRNYIYYFNKIATLDWNEIGRVSLEKGYVIFNKIISLFSDNPQVLFAVLVICVMCMIYNTYKRLCVDSTLTVLILCNLSVFIMLFSGVRQMIAVGIGMIAYEFTRKEKILPFVLSVISAMFFHTSAFMLIFMYPLYHMKITKKWLLIIIPILVAVFVLNDSIFSILSIIIERYTKYDASISHTGAYTMIVLFAIFSIFAFVIPDERKLNEEIIGLRNFLLFSLALQMFAPLHTLAMRLNYYYIIFIPLLLPQIISYRRKKWNQIAKIARYIMIGVFLVYFFYNAYVSSSNLHVFPYHFFWEAII